MTEGSDTKLRIIRRLDLLVSQPSLYIYVGQYTIVMVEVTTQEYDYNIFYIGTFYNKNKYQSNFLIKFKHFNTH